MAKKINYSIGDQLRNEACYNYLKQFAPIFVALKQDERDGKLKIHPTLKRYINQSLPQFVYHDYKQKLQTRDYQPNYNYGDAYTYLLLTLESNPESIINLHQQFEGKYVNATSEQEASEALQNMQKLEQLLDLIYNNKNDALKMTYDKIGSRIEESDALEIEHSITKLVSPGKEINQTSPQKQGSNWGRFSAMISKTFKPQTTTSLATVREYEFQKNSGLPRELRFGTQGQRHEGNVRVSPLFESWLKIKQKKLLREHTIKEDASWNNNRDAYVQVKDNPPTIQHVYINNLGLDRSGFEGNKEKALTKELHNLEQRHKNIAVITLPADKGIMSKALVNSTTQVARETAKKDLIKMAIRKSPLDDGYDPTDDAINHYSFDDVRDFHISPEIKAKIYPRNDDEAQSDAEKRIVTQLMENSFRALGLDGKDYITESEMQAAMFHFSKFELSNHILKTLNPDTFNMSCKDAIDRGGVSSAYYNLIKSIELHQTDNQIPVMSRDEFLQALHAAPTLVKGRGMNHHTRLIWNAVDAYVNNPANQQTIKNCDLAWLVSWRNENVPKERVVSFVNKGVLEQNLFDLQVERLKLEYNLNEDETDDMASFLKQLDGDERTRVYKTLTQGYTYILREEGIKDKLTSSALKDKISNYRMHNTMMSVIDSLPEEKSSQAHSLYLNRQYDELNELLLKDRLSMLPRQQRGTANLLYNQKKYDQLYKLITEIELSDEYQTPNKLTNRELALGYLRNEPFPKPVTSDGEKKTIVDAAIKVTQESIKLKNEGANDTNANNVYRVALHAHGLTKDLVNDKPIPHFANRIKRFMKVAHKIKSNTSVWQKIGSVLSSFASGIAVRLGLKTEPVTKDISNAQKMTDKFKVSISHVEESHAKNEEHDELNNAKEMRK